MKKSGNLLGVFQLGRSAVGGSVIGGALGILFNLLVMDTPIKFDH